MIRSRVSRALLGLALGTAAGWSPGRTIAGMDAFLRVSAVEYLLFAGFGVLAPMFIAWRNSASSGNRAHRLLQRFNQVADVYWLASSFALSAGLLAAYELFRVGSSDGRYAVALFFVTAGIGFAIARRFDRKLGSGAEGSSVNGVKF